MKIPIHFWRTLLPLLFAILLNSSTAAQSGSTWPSYGFVKNLEGDFNSRMRDANSSHVDVTFNKAGSGAVGDSPQWSISVKDGARSASSDPAYTGGRPEFGYLTTTLNADAIAALLALGMDLSEDALRELLLLILLHEYPHTSPATPENPDYPGGEGAPSGPQGDETAPCAHMELYLADLDRACDRAMLIASSPEFSTNEKCGIMFVICNFYGYVQGELNAPEFEGHNCPNVPAGSENEDGEWAIVHDPCISCISFAQDHSCTPTSTGTLVIPPAQNTNHHFFPQEGS